MIDTRPEAVELRKEPGRWKSDTVMGAQTRLKTGETVWLPDSH